MPISLNYGVLTRKSPYMKNLTRPNGHPSPYQGATVYSQIHRGLKTPV
ncbi:MAG: hypothetical protein SWZ49_08550 [Cyanobacteriota bacterium]|nr:hypothetical protein [Cyanobacteriota bacterium]